MENSRIINDLTRENACRAILVEIAREEEASLRAWITAHCHLSHGQKSVCCEQISFRLTGRVTGRFRNTVFSHLNSDLPLVFWWQGELSDVFTERLASVMDRLIVDSSTWADPRKADSPASARRSMATTALVVQDLAWTRCWQFRVGIAGLFDDTVAQTILGKIEKVHIRHSPGNRNTALQILAWLAVQAGWKRTGGLAFETKEGQPIGGGDRDAARTPRLSASSSSPPEKPSSASSGKRAPTHLLREIVSGDYHVSSLSPADPETPDGLVAQQLSRGGKNSLFLKILPVFLDLIG